jgi:hypothetical protein
MMFPASSTMSLDRDLEPRSTRRGYQTAEGIILARPQDHRYYFVDYAVRGFF